MKRGAVTVAGLILALAGGLAAQEQSPAATDHPQTDQQVTSQANSQAPSNSPQNTSDPATADPEPALTPVDKESDGANPGDSHVRIVRLSQTQGKLVLDRGNGKVEQTMQNMPVVENSRLATFDGYAEVEFEDGSTLRLAPDSQVNFPQLILRANGVKTTTATLLKGTMYVSLEKSKDIDFTVKSHGSVLHVEPGTHLRLEDDGTNVALAVFKGNVEVQNGSTPVTVGKNKTAMLNTSAPENKIEIAKNIDDAPYDEWDQNALDYHNHYTRGNSFSSSPYSYGIADLNYYGSFINAGGCGSMWRPYFVSSAWDPYGNGAWAWYQGAGYSWVSPYPWGWMPYHSGSWAFCSGVGWGWRPGGLWRGLRNTSPVMVGRPTYPRPGSGRGGIGLRPPGPQRPIGTPRSTLLLSNRTPLVSSKMDRPGNFVFAKDSAGFGVPRGTLGNLHGISNHVERNGFVSRQVYAEPIGPVRDGIRPGTPMTLHRGSPDWAREGGRSSFANREWRGNGQGRGLNGQADRGNWSRGDRTGNPSGGWRGGNSNSNAGGGYHGGGSNSAGGGFHGGGGASGGGGFHGGGGSVGGGGGASHGGGGGGGGGGHR